MAEDIDNYPTNEIRLIDEELEDKPRCRCCGSVLHAQFTIPMGVCSQCVADGGSHRTIKIPRMKYGR
jgi:hypothetical protein